LANGLRSRDAHDRNQGDRQGDGETLPFRLRHGGVFYNRSKINTADTSRYGARQMDTVEEVLAAADFVSLARAVVKTGISSMRNGWP
jgi:hypothetical protein